MDRCMFARMYYFANTAFPLNASLAILIGTCTYIQTLLIHISCCSASALQSLRLRPWSRRHACVSKKGERQGQEESGSDRSHKNALKKRRTNDVSSCREGGLGSTPTRGRVEEEEEEEEEKERKKVQEDRDMRNGVSNKRDQPACRNSCWRYVERDRKVGTQKPKCKSKFLSSRIAPRVKSAQSKKHP
ncbi:hypothetical protein BKA80DRAFT_3298 [Phyllosticta citrichinensis]